MTFQDRNNKIVGNYRQHNLKKFYPPLEDTEGTGDQEQETEKENQDTEPIEQEKEDNEDRNDLSAENEHDNTIHTDENYNSYVNADLNENDIFITQSTYLPKETVVSTLMWNKCLTLNHLKKK